MVSSVDIVVKILDNKVAASEAGAVRKGTVPALIIFMQYRQSMPPEPPLPAALSRRYMTSCGIPGLCAKIFSHKIPSFQSTYGYPVSVL